MNGRKPAWPDIEQLFFAGLKIPPEERDAWIARSASGTPELAAEVQSLLRAHEGVIAAEARDRAGPYRLDRLIGEGGMGEVWLASRADGEFEQRVALKLMRSGLGSKALLDRFRYERQLLARLNHPNIARLLDGGISRDGHPYLVMEYVEGQPILEYAASHGLDARARIELFRSLCSAVEYAHQNLIVHRDIKPANVLVTEEGVPKLLDFGTARLIENGIAAATQLPFLTLRYASPEQLRNEPLNTSTDVYSLGVLLFELLTGALPYSLDSESLPELIGAVTTREPVRASAMRGDGHQAVRSDDLDAILAKALEKDPRRRYPSVDRLSNDLGNYLAGRPVTARPLTPLYRFRRYVRRNWIAVSAAAAVALAVATASAVSLRAAHVARQERTRMERVTQFLEDTLSSANPYWRGASARDGASTRLADLLPSASRRVNQVFAGDLVAQARLHRVLGDVYTRLGDFPKAEAEVRAALNCLPALDTNPAEKAKVLFVAGVLDFRLSHYREEERELRGAVATLDRAPELAADPSVRATYLVTLAAVLADVRRKAEARDTAAQAERFMSIMPQSDIAAAGMLHSTLALAYLKIGDLQQARAAGETAVRQLLSSPDTLVSAAEASETLGIVERTLGHPAAALTTLQQGLNASVQALGPEDPLNIPLRIEVAYQKALDGEPVRVLDDLRRSLHQARSRTNQEDLFHALHTLGYVLTLAGRPGEGEPLLREAARVGAGFLSPAGPTMGLWARELGECLERQGRLAEALSLYQTSYDNFSAYYGDVWVTREAQSRVEHVSMRLGRHTSPIPPSPMRRSSRYGPAPTIARRP